MKCIVEMATNVIIYTKFHEHWFGYSRNVKVNTSTF
jgi:hypothetical protein